MGPAPPPLASRAPTRLEWIAAALVLVAAVAFAFIRVQAINIPWHVATARLAHETGRWPQTNTFSYTFPQHPLYQQYPAYQWTLFTALRLAGWGGVSFVSGAGWVLVLLLFARWGGRLREGAVFHLFWMFALMALWRRMMVRPDLFSMLALGLELLAFDAYARGRRWALAAVPAAHYLWVTSHQLFPLSLVVQGCFAAHLVALRTRFFRRPEGVGGAPPPIAPVLAALAVSILLTFATPLGARIVEGPLRTTQSLVLFRDQVAEFRRVWTMPLELVLALVTGVPALWGFARARRLADPFDVLLWLLSLALVLAAVRGLMFFGVISIAVFQRAAARCRAAGVELAPGLGDGARRLLGGLALALTLLLSVNAVYHRWVRAPLALGGTQPGLGRAVGGWGEGMTAFLRRARPPGRMMNVGPGAGDLVILDAPGTPVFVDSRLESYPIEFLREVLVADRDDASLDRLVARWHPQWIVAEHARDSIRARVVHLLAVGWVPVYVDSEFVILVHQTALTAPYVAGNRIELPKAEPTDLTSNPSLRAQQRARFARLMRAIGAPERAEEQRRAAMAESGADGARAFEER
ncbi:MAG TPA: hypothetical protein VHL80_18240 [Polyangia bacterium]|nr:hypothetical protein [Polyangia bacterium]